MKKYGAFGKKLMYGKTVEGTIRSTVVIGPKGEVIKHWPTVKKAEAHPEEVCELPKDRSRISDFTSNAREREWPVAADSVMDSEIDSHRELL